MDIELRNTVAEHKLLSINLIVFSSVLHGLFFQAVNTTHEG